MTGRITTLCICLAAFPLAARGQDSTFTLPWFETSWRTMEDRTADTLTAGYGRLWTSPLGKGSSGTPCVGSDCFDLDSPGRLKRYSKHNKPANPNRLVSPWIRIG